MLSYLSPRSVALHLLLFSWWNGITLSDIPERKCKRDWSLIKYTQIKTPLSESENHQIDPRVLYTCWEWCNDGNQNKAISERSPWDIVVSPYMSFGKALPPLGGINPRGIKGPFVLPVMPNDDQKVHEIWNSCIIPSMRGSELAPITTDDLRLLGRSENELHSTTEESTFVASRAHMEASNDNIHAFYMCMYS